MEVGYIIVLGNINEGFSFIGPFSSFEEASENADKINNLTWISEISLPSVVSFNS
jgi:hypothetical protein